MFRSSLSYLSSMHHEGDVAEVGVGEGGQEADAPADWPEWQVSIAISGCLSYKCIVNCE